MRWPLLGILLLAPIAQIAAQPATSAQPFLKDDLANWQHAQALPRGTYIHVDTTKQHTLCTLLQVNAESLTCDRDFGVGHKQLAFQRTDILEVKLARRGRSAVLGGTIGAGAGAIAGIPQDVHSHYFAFKGAWSLIYAFTGGFVAAPIGYITDFTASTIYKAK